MGNWRTFCAVGLAVLTLTASACVSGREPSAEDCRRVQQDRLKRIEAAAEDVVADDQTAHEIKQGLQRLERALSPVGCL
jgi:hypothetical protein